MLYEKYDTHRVVLRWNIALSLTLCYICPSSTLLNAILLYSIHRNALTHIPYSRKVWIRESLANLANHPWFAKLKPSKLVPSINNLLADLLIYQTLFRQMLKKSQFAKLSPHQTFPAIWYMCVCVCVHACVRVCVCDQIC